MFALCQERSFFYGRNLIDVPYIQLCDFRKLFTCFAVQTSAQRVQHTGCRLYIFDVQAFFHPILPKVDLFLTAYNLTSRVSLCILDFV